MPSLPQHPCLSPSHDSACSLPLSRVPSPVLAGSPGGTAGSGALRSRPRPQLTQATLFLSPGRPVFLRAPRAVSAWLTKHGAPFRPGSFFSVAAAGNAFCQAAQLHLQLQNKHDAATCFVDAGNAFKKADPQGEARGPPGLAARAPAERSVEKSSGFHRLRFLQGPTRDRLAGSPSGFNFRTGSLPMAFPSRSKPPPPLLLCVQLIAPLPLPGSIWEWEVHFRPTACQGERKICSVVRIDMQKPVEGF